MANNLILAIRRLTVFALKLTFHRQMDNATDQPEANPAALTQIQPDWNSIRERYLDGEPLAAIAADNGVLPNTISVRAYSERWKELQVRELLKDPKAVGEEIRGNLIVACLRESRMFRRLEADASPETLDIMSRVRLRLYDTTAKLLQWDADPMDKAKHVKAIDV